MPGTTATLPSPSYQNTGTITADTLWATTAGGQYTPGDQGLVAWAYDPALVTNGTNTVSGTVYLVRVPLRFSATISKVMISVTNAAATVTANQNFLGVYRWNILRDFVGSGVLATSGRVPHNFLTKHG